MAKMVVPETPQDDFFLQTVEEDRRSRLWRVAIASAKGSSWIGVTLAHVQTSPACNCIRPRLILRALLSNVLIIGRGEVEA